MIEYPSIVNSSKSPREACIAFDKLDGSNLRFKWTNKRGFDTFGTRTQLIQEQTPIYGKGVTYFLQNQSKVLDEFFRKSKDYRNFREIIVYGEFFGPNSFAGVHDTSELQKVVVFDVLLGNKNREFIKPNVFVKEFQNLIEIPKVIYVGNLNDQFITDVRENKYDLNEGALVKGTSTNGAYRGKVWMCKIKTKSYLDRVYKKFGEDGLKKFGE